ncbi:hypothetical protein EJ03DRAFT_335668 [Teratosphaeria nubilosa]|uniref:Uncharacterized protein n=1 Tax=Teratosphaeria nubilosa TaxID=161662 RepID=A0A6G1LCD0_9PEZI|nr:hypothetical protein EJ03DRAFT_335668 [Teratosphaeria nubilosa]
MQPSHHEDHGNDGCDPGDLVEDLNAFYRDGTDDSLTSNSSTDDSLDVHDGQHDDTGIERDVNMMDLTQNQRSGPASDASPPLSIEAGQVPMILDDGAKRSITYITLSAVPDAADVASTEARDVIVASRFSQTVAASKGFAEGFPQDSLTDVSETGLKRALLGPKAHLNTIRYIGSLALAGPKGMESWMQLLRGPDTRQALVMGIIGRALKEHVFSDLWFGGLEAEKKELDKIDRDLAGDGFSRTKRRAMHCAIFQSKYDGSREAHTELQKAIVKITLQLEDLLMPLFNMRALADKRFTTHHILPESHRKLLLSIVEQAALLSRFIRQIDDVVYYWPPTFKDEEFDPARMDCLNLEDMIRTSPYTKDTTLQGYERAKLNEGEESRSEAIVRVVAFPGIVAYRQGGGALAEKTLETERHSWRHDPPDVQTQKARSFRQEGTTVDSGFRTKLIAKAVVHLQWGRQRLLTKEAGTSRYLDAIRDGSMSKYDRDYVGFVELYDAFRKYQTDHPST